MNIKPIAKIYNDFPTKFALPRQSGRNGEIKGKIVFEKEFRDENAVRGIEQFSHIWLIWGFSENEKEGWSPTVRPPRLGGNRRVGVFASRSPFRPNPIGISCVKLEAVEKTKDEGVALIVSSADLMNGTPIYDIKPYIPYTDRVEGAKGGYAEENKEYGISVDIDDNLVDKIDESKRAELISTLADDPRPAYQNDGREYGFYFSYYEIKFVSNGEKIKVTEINKVK